MANKALATRDLAVSGGDNGDGSRGRPGPEVGPPELSSTRLGAGPLKI